MNKVGIVADSAVNIPEELLQKYRMQVVPLLLILENKSYKDTIDIKTAGELFRLVEKSDKFPTTSAPPPTNYLEVYRQLSQKVDNILCITISSGLSMSFNSATMAKEMAQSELPDVNIEVFDSRTTVGAYGFIALAAAQAAASGQDMAQVTEVASRIREKVNCVFIFDTLSYLSRSGRIGRASALMGNMLSIKPIVEVSSSTGLVEPVARVRTKSKAVQHLLEIVRQRSGTDDQLHIMIEHTCSPEEAERLNLEVQARFKCAEILMSEFNPVASLITGPGVLGLSFYSGTV